MKNWNSKMKENMRGWKKKHSRIYKPFYAALVGRRTSTIVEVDMADTWYLIKALYFQKDLFNTKNEFLVLLRITLEIPKKILRVYKTRHTDDL